MSVHNVIHFNTVSLCMKMISSTVMGWGGGQGDEV